MGGTCREPSAMITTVALLIGVGLICNAILRAGWWKRLLVPWIIVGASMTQQHPNLSIGRPNQTPVKTRELTPAKKMSKGVRIIAARRRCRQLSDWGTERQKAPVRAAFIPEERPTAAWPRRQARRWWRSAKAKHARAQMRSRASQTVGVAFQHPDYLRLAQQKGIIAYVDEPMGAMKYAVRVKRGLIPVVAAFPTGKAHEIWVPAEAAWLDVRMALAAKLKMNATQLDFTCEGRACNMTDALPRQTLDAAGNVVLLLSRKKRSPAESKGAKPLYGATQTCPEYKVQIEEQITTERAASQGGAGGEGRPLLVRSKGKIEAHNGHPEVRCPDPDRCTLGS